MGSVVELRESPKHGFKGKESAHERSEDRGIKKEEMKGRISSEPWEGTILGQEQV